MTFAHIEWLFLLIALPVIALASWLAWKRRGDRWKQLVAERLRRRLSQSRPGWTHFAALGLALIGLGALIVALAQPESGEEWIEVESEGRNILFCIDISRSMLTPDVAPNRLVAARAAALEVLEKFPNDRVGVLLFSGNVLIQAPLTIDHGYIETTLSQLEPEDIPSGGSDLTQAIRDGTALLVGTGQRSNIMVVFSDGEKSSSGLESAAAEAAEAGVFIYALGFGKDGDFIPDPEEQDGKFRDRDGRPVYSKLDEASLRSIAERTEGFYSRGIGRDFIAKLDRALSQMDRFEESGKNQRVAKPAHKWFLLGGLLFIMTSVLLRCFPTRSLGVLLACLVFTPSVKASLIGEGRTALENGDYRGAYQAFESAAGETSGERAARLHLAAGSAAFEAKDWTPAADAFSEALATADPGLQHEAHYGLATSLFYLGAPLKGEEQTKAWQGAVNHYQQALQLQSDNERTLANLKTIQDLLIQKEQQQQEDEKQDPQKSDDEKKDEEKKDEDKKEEGDENEGEGESEEKSDQEKQKGGDDQEKNDQKKSGQGDENEPQKPEDGEGQNKKDPTEGSPDQEKDDGKGNGDADPENQQEKNEPEPGDGDDEQNTKNSDDPGDREDEMEKKNPKEAPLAEPTNESPEERARRLLRQFADFGAKAPRHTQRPFRRSAHDW